MTNTDRLTLLDGIREEVRQAIEEGDAQDCSSSDCIADAVYEIVRVRLRDVILLDEERLARAIQATPHQLLMPPHPGEVYASSAVCSCGEWQFDSGSFGALTREYKLILREHARHIEAEAAQPAPLDERYRALAAAAERVLRFADEAVSDNDDTLVYHDTLEPVFADLLGILRAALALRGHSDDQTPLDRPGPLGHD